MRVLIAAATTAVAIGALPALAQAQSAAGPYVDLGYANAHSSDADLGAVAGGGLAARDSGAVAFKLEGFAVCVRLPFTGAAAATSGPRAVAA